MIKTGFDSKIKIQEIVENQLPEFVLSESPKALEFLKQYYVSQEYQGGPVDLVDNLDQYLNLNNLTPDITGEDISLLYDIDSTVGIITVSSTKGFPNQYGLLKIDDEIITYTGITTNSFTGCIRGFSGITSYRSPENPEELIFQSSSSSNHNEDSKIQNLSALFLKEFFKKLKYYLASGLENVDFIPELNVNNFIKSIKSFFKAKGTDEAIKILLNILYGVKSRVVNLENFLIKPSNAEFIRREVLVVEKISGDPNKLVGQVVKKYDDSASGPVSEVEIIARNKKTYYKIQLFAGYNQQSLIEGSFNITGNTKVIDRVSIGSSIITVDSTIGFPQSGTLFSGENIISYSDKSINQFFGCSGISAEINSSDEIRSNEIIYGYENGDINKRVEMRVTGVLSNLEDKDKIYLFSEGDVISIKSIGDKIKNPNLNKSYKELIFNSWIYNTSSRYEVNTFANNVVTLYEFPDKSSLKVNDYVTILDRNSENIILDDVVVLSIDSNIITLNRSIVGISPQREISIRRKLNYASSSNVPLKYSRITSNIQNTYNENDQFINVAANSLPDYSIDVRLVQSSVNVTSTSQLTDIFQGYDETYLDYSIISFSNNVEFINGDAVIYTGSNSPLTNLIFGETYYVQVLDDNLGERNKIRLYGSRSFVGTDDGYIRFTLDNPIGSHTFTLSSQSGRFISPKKYLAKLPLSQDIQSGKGKKTEVGSVGILVNGVEIINYKSNDRIYYGPISRLKIYNSGSDYDVLNPPKLDIGLPVVGVGTSAQSTLVVRGSVKEVFVDPNDVDLVRCNSVTISGGNGSGAILKPILERKYREVEFNASLSTNGGGLNIENDTILFLRNHNLSNGTPIIYNRNGNEPLGIGSFGGSNQDQNRYLINGSIYYPEVVNARSIKLYENLSDLNSGINTVGFTTINTGNIHKFRLLGEKNVLKEIKVINPGQGYENRSLKLKASGISTTNHIINFVNHNFKEGDIVRYQPTQDGIVGLSTTNQYYVLKIDNDSFRICDAGEVGIGTSGTSRYNYIRKNYVKFSSVGEGYHIFSYPEIKISLDVEYAGSIGTITATPVIRGEIVDAYLDDPGSGYGSKILNFHKKPLVKIKSGFNAQIRPIITNGRITSVQVQSPGTNFYSVPDLVVNGDGVGAKLRAIVSNGSITRVVIINGGANYTSTKTSISIVPSGKNAFIEASVRFLTVNNYSRFSDQFLQPFNDGLSYGIVGYSTIREGSAFSDPNPDTGHSKIIGWCYDGNPIYGPYGFSDPNDSNSPISILNTGYALDLNSIEDRPSTDDFEPGFFVEDYKFNNSGDLDYNNGRFAKTPEFPEGVYAYYVGVTTGIFVNQLVPKFPYFIGDTYRSSLTNGYINDQTFDFNSSNLVRNTFPYRINEQYSGNDFIIEASDTVKQTSVINSVTTGSIEDIEIRNSGDDYRVGELVLFDNSETTGSNASAKIKSIVGKDINEIRTSYEYYNNAVFSWVNENEVEVKISPYHNLIDGDSVNITGLSTSIKNLNTFYRINYDSELTTLNSGISSNAYISGIVTDIFVSNIPRRLSIGSTIEIGTEKLSVLNIFNQENVLRVKRGISTSEHSSGSIINFYPDYFRIPVKTNYFDSKVNDLVYFNPTLSVGVGTTSGIQVSINFLIGNSNTNISVPTQSIYLPNHPFRNNQRVLLTKSSTSSPLLVSNESSGSSFNLPNSGNSQYVYILNKSRDFIGILTEINSSNSTSNGLYFINNGSDSYDYRLRSDFYQVTGKVEKIKAKVSLSTSHNLEYGDLINLSVNPSLTTGIGTLESVKIKYDSSYNKILVNPIGFTSESVDTDNNQIVLNGHNLKTGQKIFYSSADIVASGLSTGSYFVIVNNENSLSLCETYSDTLTYPPNIISIGSTGGQYQEITQINPELTVFRNNSLSFDVTDPSLVGYNLRIFYDKDLKNEFISIGSTNSFLVERIGSSGISSSVLIKYNENIPDQLYYSLERNGQLIESDKENISNYSKISYKNSYYNGDYQISGIGLTSFNICLNKKPEELIYYNSDCDELFYTTTSTSDSGPIDKLSIISNGFNYNKLPKILGITTFSSGKNAVLNPTSTNIGKISDIRIVTEGFEYTSDKTLKPIANVPRVIGIENSDKISSAIVLDGGRNYISPPSLVLVNNYTRQIVPRGLIVPIIRGSSIVSVDIIDEPRGLQSVDHTLFSINNSNGVQVERILSYVDGIVECELVTPAVDGFVVPPFRVGDLIFVEGLQRQSLTDELGNLTFPGTGFNSTENGFNFFEVVYFSNSNPAILRYDIGRYTDNAGIVQELQTSFNSIVVKNNYPDFKLEISDSLFYVNESLLINGQSSDLVISSVESNTIKVFGESELNENDIITGYVSGNRASVGYIVSHNNAFKVDYSNKKNFGWKNDTGKLNTDVQIIQDSDYYQSLSYSIKSTIEYEDLKDHVNRMVHPVGLKNFADTELFSLSNVSIGISEKLSQILDFVSERRVDTVKDFDLVLDYDVTGNSSRYIKFRNKRLADFIECRTNRVLQIDDISNRFSSAEYNRDPFVDVVEYPITDFYSKYLVQINDEDKNNYQLSELVVINNFDNTFTLNKFDLYSSEKLGDLTGDFGDTGDPILRFYPLNPFDFNYNIRVYRETFSSSPFNIGVGFTNIGFVRLSSKTERITPLTGITTDVFRAQSSIYDTIYSSIQIINEQTYEMNYFETFGYYDGQNQYISEFYFDTERLIGGTSSGYIGTFGLVVDNGVISLRFTKNTGSNILIKAKVIGFGSTSLGIGTYRYLVDDQIPGTEKSSRLESNYFNRSGICTFISYDNIVESSVKSLVKISIGSSITSLHQIMIVSDQINANILQYPFVSIGNTSGIGTFGVSMDSGIVNVKFYPDSQYSSQNYVMQTYNQFMYYDIDEFNIPERLAYGTAEESFDISFYGSLNQFGKDRLDFDLNYNRIPIFQKTFNPRNSNVLNPETGIFTIPNHFFQSGEELIYTPDSTLVGVDPQPIGIGSTLVGGRRIIGDIIAGFSTITGIGSSEGISGTEIKIIGNNIPPDTEIVSIGRTYTYFIGNVVSGGSSVITGIANTTILTIGSGIYSGNNLSFGNIVSIGINSITSSTIVNAGDDILYYSTDDNWAVTMSNVAVATTFRKEFTTGISTNICPTTVYAIKLSKDTFKLTGTSGNSGVGFTFTSTGFGNVHKLEMKKKLEKSLISINGVNQYPLTYTPLSFTLENNIGGIVGSATTFISLSGIGSVLPRDMLKIDDEIVYISNVGLATVNDGFGPITGIGTIPVVEVVRGWVGTSATSHSDGTEVRVYKGSYNIVGNKIWFTEAPDGKGNNNRFDASLLRLPKSNFNGRVYLRKDYTTNKIYDDISGDFTGVARTFSMKKDGEDTFGVETGSNLLFINDIFQTPDTENNSGQNYKFTGSVGVTTLTFTSITRPNTDDVIIVDYDVNQNQLPRGGVLVSVGSSGGLGYAPLVGASVTATLNSGSIISIGIGNSGSYGSGYRGNVSIGITDSTGYGAEVTAAVGAGGTLIFNVVSGGSNYTNPVFEIDSPSYQDLSIIGISRLGVGETTRTGIGLSITVDVGPNTLKLPGKNTDASGLIDANKVLIAEVAVGRMLAAFPTFSIPGGNQNCIDDIIDVLEAISYNLKFGGNDKVYEAAQIYIDNAYLSGEEQESIYAYHEARDMAVQAMRNEQITIGGYSTLSQYFDNTIQGDISGIPGVYNPGDCSDVESAINSFVGIVTYAIGTSSIPASKTVAPGSLFEVNSFTLTKQGYGFRLGDVFEVVGLVTDARLNSPVDPLRFTVTDISTDSFASWQLGEFDYIDSIRGLQDGVRTRFPLFRNNQLLSFDINRSDIESSLIDFDSILLIFINGVMQEPKVSYTFNGGTTFRFTEAPRPEDNVAIFFYRGTRDEDSVLIDVNETIKVGDTLQIKKNNNILGTIGQEERIVSVIQSADIIETGIYLGDGIDENNFKPIDWSKQKRDLIINEVFEYKSRDSLEPLVFPNAKVIKTISPGDTEIFVDDSRLFNYEENESDTEINSFSGLLFEETELTPGSITVNVDSNTQISSITVIDGGSGYGYIGVGNSIDVIIPRPKSVGPGIGTTALARVQVSAAGTLTLPEIVNPGFGYTVSPTVLVPPPVSFSETIENIRFVQGFSGIVTGITTSSGVGGHTLSIVFQVKFDPNSDNDSLLQNYPIYVFDTSVGNGVTSVNFNDASVVGVGTTYLDNIYYVHSIFRDNLIGTITTNVLSTTNISGITTSNNEICGRFSWGRLSGFNRSLSSPEISVTGYTVNSGLGTFPVIQRRAYGLRDTGALRKELFFNV